MKKTKKKTSVKKKTPMKKKTLGIKDEIKVLRGKPIAAAKIKPAVKKPDPKQYEYIVRARIRGTSAFRDSRPVKTMADAKEVKHLCDLDGYFESCEIIKVEVILDDTKKK